eukprot:4310685-Pleurochrysis_carterae.AAC.1
MPTPPSACTSQHALLAEARRARLRAVRSQDVAGRVGRGAPALADQQTPPTSHSTPFPLTSTPSFSRPSTPSRYTRPLSTLGHVGFARHATTSHKCEKMRCVKEAETSI